MWAACPQPCPWGQPLGCCKDGAHNEPPKLLGAEHRIKWLSRTAASSGEAPLPVPSRSHVPPPACWSWGHIPALPAWRWLDPAPLHVASGCCARWRTRISSQQGARPAVHVCPSTGAWHLPTAAAQRAGSGRWRQARAGPAPLRGRCLGTKPETGLGWKWEAYRQTSKYPPALETTQAAGFKAEPTLPWARRLVPCSPSPWHGRGDVLEDTWPGQCQLVSLMACCRGWS